MWIVTLYPIVYERHSTLQAAKPIYLGQHRPSKADTTCRDRWAANLSQPYSGRKCATWSSLATVEQVAIRNSKIKFL